MHHCGLDIALKSTHVYIEDAQGHRVADHKDTSTSA